MKNIIITIEREYGSGGKYIGEEVAKRLDYKFYDKELLNEIYENNDCNYALLEEFDEKTKSSLLKSLGLVSIENDSMFTEEKYHGLVKETIKKLAESSSCVFIGRDTNQILKNEKNAIHFFIYAKDEEFKIRRKMERENLSYEQVKEKMHEVDRMRKKFYESLNKGHTWGIKEDYDFCIDSSVLGIDKTIELILEIIQKFQNNEECKDER